MKYNVTVGIVNYNDYKHAKEAIRSILENTRGVNVRIYIIDNASTDGSAEKLAADYSMIEVILSDKNIGYGGANNLVLDKIDSQYHVIMNADVILQEDVFSELYHFMQDNPDIVMCTPAVRFMDGREQYLPKRDPKLKYLLANRLPGKKMKQISDYYKMKEKDLTEVTDVEFASGCFLFCRTDVLKSVGGFDPRYFLYLEDADLSRTMRNFGRVVFYPHTHIYHNYARASAKKLNFLLIHISSMLKYIFKWRKYERNKIKRMKGVLS